MTTNVARPTLWGLTSEYAAHAVKDFFTPFKWMWKLLHGFPAHPLHESVGASLSNVIPFFGWVLYKWKVGREAHRLLLLQKIMVGNKRYERAKLAHADSLVPTEVSPVIVERQSMASTEKAITFPKTQDEAS
jgi:hypothetical protein